MSGVTPGQDEEVVDEPLFQIREKRSWMLEQEEAAATNETEAPQKKLPTYLAQLETRTEKAEQALQKRLSELNEEKTAFQKRMQAELEKKVSIDNRKLLEKFIVVLDSLSMALSSSSSEAAQGLVQGVELTRKQFLTALQDAGVVLVEAVGTMFNPQIHEALQLEVVTDPKQDGQVLQVLQDGYLFGEQLIRPAKVTVGKYSKS